MKQFFRSLHLNWTDTLVSIFGSAFLAFGLYNVHALSGVTEGGVLGLTLLLDHWFSRRCFRKLRTIRCLPRWSARSLSAWARAYVSARAARQAETTRWQ